MISQYHCDNWKIFQSYTAYPSLLKISFHFPLICPPHPLQLPWQPTIIFQVMRQTSLTESVFWYWPEAMALHLMLPPYWRKTSSNSTLRLDRCTPKVYFSFQQLSQLFCFILAMKYWLQHVVTKAIVLCEEPIRLCTSSPSNAHLIADITVRNKWPSDTQSLTPDMEGDSSTIP